MNTPVFITVPKYVAITPNPLTRVTAMEVNSNCGSSSSSSDEISACRGKKRRLDHLSWEEKLQRKKLKNRVAAQTSRDRKKARMEEMEQTVNELTEKTEILQNKCDSLQAINDSLLEKNQRLDKEVEQLKEQLEKLQSTHHARTQQPSNCVDFDSILKGSAAGNEGITINDTKRQAPVPVSLQRELSCSTLEDCSALPSLQDMFEDFDATKLEELAESLLADITADMEGSHPESHREATQDASIAERLSGSVVGTTPEVLESSQHTSSDNISIDTISDTTSLLNTQDTSIDTGETIYGTYDEKTNSITIVVGDDSVAMNEAVEEVYCEGEEPTQEEGVIECGMTSDDVGDDDEDFDPIEKFLSLPTDTRKNCVKSPLSIHSYSDPGYESIGSPQSDFGSTISTFDEMAWNNSINDLFPSLL